MTAQQERAAADVVRRAAQGELGPDGNALLYLFKTASDRGRAAETSSDKLEREANALAAVVADLLIAARDSDALRRIVDAVVDDLPHNARQRVNAYRNQRDLPSFRAWNSFGQALPTVPPRVSVMRERVHTIDLQPVDVETSPL